MSSTTTHYSFIKPTVGGDVSAWGGYLNTSLDMIDTQFFNTTGGLSTNNLFLSSNPSTSVAATLTFQNGSAPAGQKNRWALVEDTSAESGGNAGSNFQLVAYNDAGTAISAPLTVARSTGNATFVGTTTMAAATVSGTANIFTANITNATFVNASFTSALTVSALNVSGASGTYRAVNGNTGTSPRWGMALGDNAPESGGNAGSNFSLGRFTDSGAAIDDPLTIIRSTGQAIFTQAPLAPSFFTNGASGTYRAFEGQTNQVNRWTLLLGDNAAETGSNVGSNFSLYRYSDAGVLLDVPLSISRLTGAIQASANISAGGTVAAAANISAGGVVAAATHVTAGGNIAATGGYMTKAGTSGAVDPTAGQRFNIQWTGSVANLWIDAVSAGTITLTSDYRAKENIAPLPSMWGRAKALKPVSYNLKDFGPVKAAPGEKWGFVAHELQDTLIQDAATGTKDAEDLIQSPNPWTVIAVLTKALQEAMERIEALEAA